MTPEEQAVADSIIHLFPILIISIPIGIILAIVVSSFSKLNEERSIPNTPTKVPEIKKFGKK